MPLRLLLVATLAVGLTACADSADDVAIDGDVSTTGEFSELPEIPSGTYAIDPSHTRAEFRVRHLGITSVTGRFGSVDGTVEVGDETIAANVVIDASSIDTGNDDRDGHLQSADFFDVAQYPEITFQSTGVRPTADGGFVLTGDLTMHVVTRPVELESEYLGAATMGETDKVGFTARGEITRQDWGLDWDQTNEVGEALVGDEVELIIEVQADRQDATPEIVDGEVAAE